MKFFGKNREYFMIVMPNGMDSKLLECMSCGDKIEAGKAEGSKLTCFKCLYPGAEYCHE